MTGDESLRLALEQAQATIAKQQEELSKQSQYLEQMDRFFITGKVENLNKPKASLTELCQIVKEACDVVQPMVKLFYQKCSESYGTAKLKSDATFFSIADGIVQHLMVEYLFAGDKFGQIVGEEDETDVNIRMKPFHVDELIVPEEFEDMVSAIRLQIQNLAKKIDSNSYKGLTICGPY